MIKLIAAVVGALLAGVLVVGIVVVFHRTPGPENWDMGTPMLMLGALLPAGVIGAVGGFLVPWGGKMVVCSPRCWLEPSHWGWCCCSRSASSRFPICRGRNSSRPARPNAPPGRRAERKGMSRTG